MLRRARSLVGLLIVSVCCGAIASQLFAESPRVLAPGKLPDDARLGDLKTLNDYFPFTPPASAEAWQRRSDELRRQLLVATGLWPMPSKTPANAVVHGKVTRDGYTVERVYFESFPGHFVSGSLYRPTGKSGRLPVVLCPHGHWPGGRFNDGGRAKGPVMREQIALGAERFEVGGRHPLQARCVQLARMGCVVFHYDMVGYADSQQLEHRLGVREAMNTPQHWGYFSPQAELRLQTQLGLQTYNSVRALDWVLSLPDVDPTRIGVTGASGGGTQTFLLGAVDPRPTVIFPAVMVGTAMQGGCTCENCSYLRVNTGNVEIAGLFAPKPLGMTGADDWTKELDTKGLPELQQLYKMLGVSGNVMGKVLRQFPHNYNYVSRGVMYSWFNKHLGLKVPEPVVEEDYVPLTEAELTVWDDAHPKPPRGDDYERSLVKYITQDSDKQIAALTPRDEASLAKYREIVGGAAKVMIGRGLPVAGEIEHKILAEKSHGDYAEIAGVLRNKLHHEETPMVLLTPKSWNRHVVIWVDPQGKAGLYGSDGGLRPEVQKLLDGGVGVLGIDLIGTGEFTVDGLPAAKARLIAGGRDLWTYYAGYTYGYNHTLFAQRVHDLLGAVFFVRDSELKPERVSIVGLGAAGPWVAATRAIAGQAIDRAVIDTAGFRFAKLTTMDDPNFLPGVVKYGDLPALLALGAPGKTWLVGEADVPPVVKAAYKAAGVGDRVELYEGDKAATSDAMLKWLTR